MHPFRRLIRVHARNGGNQASGGYIGGLCHRFMGSIVYRSFASGIDDLHVDQERT